MARCTRCKKDLGWFQGVGWTDELCEECQDKEKKEKQDRLKKCIDGKKHDFNVKFDVYWQNGGRYDFKRVRCNKPTCTLNETVWLGEEP